MALNASTALLLLLIFFEYLFWRATLRPHSSLYHETNIYSPQSTIGLLY